MGSGISLVSIYFERSPSNSLCNKIPRGNIFSSGEMLLLFIDCKQNVLRNICVCFEMFLIGERFGM